MYNKFKGQELKKILSFLPLKMGPTDRLETSIRNYH
jgi:hypothetical protein